MHLDLLLNLMAQGVIRLQQARQWFDSLPDSEQETAMRKLIHFIYQAKVCAQDIPVFLPSALCFACLKPTHTPVQMLKALERQALKDGQATGRGHLVSMFMKFSQLPVPEKQQAWRLLLGIMNYAYLKHKDTDDRKWWFKDLSDVNNYSESNLD
jgi:hypothetical protein